MLYYVMSIIWRNFVSSPDFPQGRKKNNHLRLVTRVLDNFGWELNILSTFLSTISFQKLLFIISHQQLYQQFLSKNFSLFYFINEIIGNHIINFLQNLIFTQYFLWKFRIPKSSQPNTNKEKNIIEKNIVLPSEVCHGIGQAEDAGANHSRNIVKCRKPPFCIPWRCDRQPFFNFLLFFAHFITNIWMLNRSHSSGLLLPFLFWLRNIWRTRRE